MAGAGDGGAGARRTHVVRQGETLSGIAQKNGLSWHALARANHILRPDELKVGTTLRIPALTGGSGPKSPLPPPPPLPGPPGGPLPPTASPRLGDLSMRYETSFRPGQEAQAAGVVSTGAGDPGGVSYGAYQLASSAKGGHQVQAFLRANGLPWAARFASKDPTRPAGDFAKTWHEVAAKEGMVFFLAQHACIERTHYAPVVNYVRKATGLDTATRSRPVQNAIWSASVQHGQAPRIIAEAVRRVGPPPEGGDPKQYDRSLIDTIYDVRSDYTEGRIAIGLHPIHLNPTVVKILDQRYASERREALEQVK